MCGWWGINKKQNGHQNRAKPVFTHVTLHWHYPKGLTKSAFNLEETDSKSKHISASTLAFDMSNQVL